MWNYREFQVQYYDMPRKPGSRIESPDTLGRKCWAFAWLDGRTDVMEAAHARLFSAGLTISFFATQWEVASPEAMLLCRRVMENWCVHALLIDASRG